MKLSHHKIFIAVTIFVSLLAVTAFSQDNTNTASAAPETAPTPIPAPETAPQAKEIAIYGEVQAIDASAGTLSVQYYDYDSDSEKSAEIAVDADTKMENAAALGDIKKSDWVDVTYVTKDGKNAAKVVTVEKEEAPASEGTSESPDEPETNLPLEQ